MEMVVSSSGSLFYSPPNLVEQVKITKRRMAETISPSSFGLTFLVSPLVVAADVALGGDDGLNRDGQQDGDGPAVDTTIATVRAVDGANRNLVETTSSAAPQIPVISINLERLVGYHPETKEEIDSIRQQLLSSMWKRYRQRHHHQEEQLRGKDSGSGGGDIMTSELEITSSGTDDDENDNTPVIPPPDFDDQIRELLEAKVARFGIPDPPSRQKRPLSQQPSSNRSSHSTWITDPVHDSSTSSSSYLVLSYPPNLLLPTMHDASVNGTPDTALSSTTEEPRTTPATSFLDTEQVWAEIQRLETTLVKGHTTQLRTRQRQDDTDESCNIVVDESNDHDDNTYESDFDGFDDDGHDDDDDGHGNNSSRVEFLARLAKHLRDTSRPLLWKHAMAIELQLCVEEELARLAHDDWVQSKRRAKLEHLYSVRETLVHQARLARDKHAELEEIREDQVQQEVLQYTRREKARLLNGSLAGSLGNGNHEFLDCFGTSELSFPEEFQLLGMMPDKLRDTADEDEDDWGILEESGDDLTRSDRSFSGLESDVDDASNVDTDGDCDGIMPRSSTIPRTGSYDEMENTANHLIPCELSSTQEECKSQTELQIASEELENSDMGQVSTEEREGSKMSQGVDHRNLGVTQLIATPSSCRNERKKKATLPKQQDRIEARKAMEKELRIEYTTKDLILAQTLLQAMEKKVQNVEELLESLQDEVWATEEEEEDDCEHRHASSESVFETLDDKNSSFSLLDQVLAMILGALPIEQGCEAKDHFEFVRQEHTSIVQGWEAYFGRLPPASK